MTVRGVLIIVGVLGCSGPQADRSIATERETAAEYSSQLMDSPTGLIAGRDNVVVLQQEMSLDVGTAHDIGYASDVAALADGAIAILDRVLGRVVVLSPEGEHLATIGRRGRGPGEFDSPMAMTEAGGRLIVLEPSSSRTLTILDWQGRSRPTTIDLDGDWPDLRRRGPIVFFSGTVGEGFEDPTRRLAAVNDSTIALEIRSRAPSASPQSYIVQINLATARIDTIAILPAPVPVRTPDGRSMDSVHVRRSMWALADGQLFVSRRTERTIEMLGDEETERLVGWTPRIQPLSSADREATGAWLGEYTIRHDPAAAQVYDRLSPSERRAAVAAFAERLAFADVAPEITALRVSGRCVFIGGFNAKEARDGIAQSWVIIDRQHGSAPRLMRFPHPDTRWRDTRDNKAYVTRLNELGSSMLEVYSLPATCRSE